MKTSWSDRDVECVDRVLTAIADENSDCQTTHNDVKEELINLWVHCALIDLGIIGKSDHYERHDITAMPIEVQGRLQSYIDINSPPELPAVLDHCLKILVVQNQRHDLITIAEYRKKREDLADTVQFEPKVVRLSEPVETEIGIINRLTFRQVRYVWDYRRYVTNPRDASVTEWCFMRDDATLIELVFYLDEYNGVKVEIFGDLDVITAMRQDELRDVVYAAFDATAGNTL